MAEGEFALVKDHLAVAGRKPISSRGFLMNETERYFLLADLAVLERDEVGLQEYAPLAEEMALRDGHILYQASAHRAWGVHHRLTGDYEEAEVRFNQALQLFQGLKTRWQIGRTLYELGELALIKQDTTRAREYFSLALMTFEDMRAVPDAARTHAALAALT